MLKSYDKDPECPACHQNTIPSSFHDRRDEDDFFAVTCQNKECRVIIDKDKKIIGKWTINYKKVKWYKTLLKMVNK